MALSFQNRAIDFINNTIGIAYANTMCSPGSVAVVKDNHYSAISTGSVFAHMLGILFDMPHDNSEYFSVTLYVTKTNASAIEGF